MYTYNYLDIFILKKQLIRFLRNYHNILIKLTIIIVIQCF